MATSLFAKLIRNQSQYQTITRKITVSHLTTTTSSSGVSGGATPFYYLQTPQTNQFSEIKTQHPILFDPCFEAGIYPSFSFQHFLNPVSPFAPDLDAVVSDTDNEQGSDTMWADSVKKKRKKKMNKHKLKKLRKKLRRKTKK